MDLIALMHVVAYALEDRSPYEIEIWEARCRRPFRFLLAFPGLGCLLAGMICLSFRLFGPRPMHPYGVIALFTMGIGFGTVVGIFFGFALLDYRRQRGRRPVVAVETVDTPRSLQLLPRSGAGAQAIFVDRPILRIGRNPLQVDRAVRDRRVSTCHLELRSTGGEWRVADLGSTNGTYLNGRRVEEPVAIRNGDVLRFGDCEYLVRWTS